MNHQHELEAGTRFPFGDNWLRFLGTLNEDRIRLAEESLTNMLGDIRGKSFLDVGCGSGLSSLAAYNLGARVHSFDYDPQSVACTREIQTRYRTMWPVEAGSALDAEFLSGLGKFDVVYSWGVLHHTGDMWRAISNVGTLVAPGGLLLLAIYNDQGWRSRVWRVLKSQYNRYTAMRWLMLSTYAPVHTVARTLVRAIKGKPLERGMSIWHDAVDWLGGYPFEVATPSAVENYLAGSFALQKVQTTKRKGCNEFVFRKLS